MTKQIKVQDLAYELTDITNQFGLVENYLNGLSLLGTQEQNDFVLYSLLHENGLWNTMETIRALKMQVQDIADLICDSKAVITKEVAANG